LKLHETEETHETVGRDSRSLGRESKVIFLKYRALVSSDKNSVTSGALPPRMLSVLGYVTTMSELTVTYDVRRIK
jgi:hypothetical protein